MKTQEFEDIILKNRLYLIEKVLGEKADEYARGDRLSNFKKAGKLLDCTPETALFSIASKHIIALSDFCNDLEKGCCQPIERWVEKIGDIINYMILLEALVVERHQINHTPR